MVQMKALQDRCTAKEGVVTRLHTHLKNAVDAQQQYREANKLLGGEVKKLTEQLEAESRQRKLEEQAKVTAEKELKGLLSQVETARVDAVTEFKDSQSFIDSCTVYYTDGFEDCLKQVKAAYPSLDLSRIDMDEPLLSTPASDSLHEGDAETTKPKADSKDGGFFLAQPALESSVTLAPSDDLRAEKSNAEDASSPILSPSSTPLAL